MKLDPPTTEMIQVVLDKGFEQCPHCQGIKIMVALWLANGIEHDRDTMLQAMSFILPEKLRHENDELLPLLSLIVPDAGLKKKLDPGLVLVRPVLEGHIANVSISNEDMLYNIPSMHPNHFLRVRLELIVENIFEHTLFNGNIIISRPEGET